MQNLSREQVGVTRRMYARLVVAGLATALAAGLTGCQAMGAGPTPTPKQWKTPPAMTIDTKKQYTATIKTTDGDLKVELFPKEAPKTVNNFVFLAREGFYDNVKFHRII